MCGIVPLCICVHVSVCLCVSVSWYLCVCTCVSAAICFCMSVGCICVALCISVCQVCVCVCCCFWVYWLCTMVWISWGSIQEWVKWEFVMSSWFQIIAYLRDEWGYVSVCFSLSVYECVYMFVCGKGLQTCMWKSEESLGALILRCLPLLIWESVCSCHGRVCRDSP